MQESCYVSFSCICIGKLLCVLFFKPQSSPLWSNYVIKCRELQLNSEQWYTGRLKNFQKPMMKFENVWQISVVEISSFMYFYSISLTSEDIVLFEEKSWTNRFQVFGGFKMPVVLLKLANDDNILIFCVERMGTFMQFCTFHSYKWRK